jgi:hypothetical protein
MKKGRCTIKKLSVLLSPVFVFTLLLCLLFPTMPKGISADQPKENTKNTAVLSGKVIETMDSGRYTYVCLEKNKKKTWVAVYKMKVVVGQEMSFKPGIEMVNFESKTLNRKFDKIYFSGGPVNTEK